MDKMCWYVAVLRVSTQSRADSRYLNLPLSVFVPALLSSLALIICCLCYCLRHVTSY